MRIRFKRLTRVTAFLNVCEKTGVAKKQQIWEFDPNEELDVLEVKFGGIVKVKTRPDRPGGRFNFYRIYLKNENSNLSCPDYLDEVLETDFEVL